MRGAARPHAGDVRPRASSSSTTARPTARDRAAAGGATLVRRDRNGGPAAARNTGVAHVDTPFVAFLDADTRPPADWIERLGGHFDDPRVAAVAPRIAERLLDMGPRRNVPYVPSRRADRPHASSRTSTRRCATARTSTSSGGCATRAGACVYEPDVVVEHDEHAHARAGASATARAPRRSRRRHPTRLRHVSFPRTRTRAVARELAARGRPAPARARLDRPRLAGNRPRTRETRQPLWNRRPLG